MWHGDIALAGLSAFGIVPLVGDATKTVAKVGKVFVKNIDNVPFVVGLIKKATKIHPDLAVAMAKNDDTITAINKILDNPKGKVTKAEFEELSLIAKNVDEVFQLGSKVLSDFNIDKAYVKPKHLSTNGGNGAKFLCTTKK